MKREFEWNFLAFEDGNGRGAVSHVHKHDRFFLVEFARIIGIERVEDKLSHVFWHKRDVSETFHVQCHLKTTKMRLGEVEWKLR